MPTSVECTKNLHCTCHVFRCFFQQLRGISGGSSLNYIFTESSEKNECGVRYVENCQKHVHLEVLKTIDFKYLTSQKSPE